MLGLCTKPFPETERWQIGGPQYVVVGDFPIYVQGIEGAYKYVRRILGFGQVQIFWIS